MENELTKKEKKKIYDKAYRDINKDRLNQERAYRYDKNKVSELLQMKEYRKINKIKLSIQKKEHTKNNPKDWRIRTFKHRYGMTVNDYNNMLEKQNSQCAICGVHADNLKKSLHIDHCHVSKNIRGLLCQKCNSMLGLANDNLNILKKAIEYLNAAIPVKNNFIHN